MSRNVSKNFGMWSLRFWSSLFESRKLLQHETGYQNAEATGVPTNSHLSQFISQSQQTARCAAKNLCDVVIYDDQVAVTDNLDCPWTLPVVSTERRVSLRWVTAAPHQLSIAPSRCHRRCSRDVFFRAEKVPFLRSQRRRQIHRPVN